MGQGKFPEDVFDVLYDDKIRLASFYAQVFAGVLERVSTRHDTSEVSGKSVSYGIRLLKGEKEGETSVGEQIETVTTPKDLAYIDLLGGLKEMSYLCPTLEHVQVGSLVCLDNIRISLVDATNLHEFMNTMPLRNLTSGTKREQREQEKELKGIRGVLNALHKMIPLGIQLRCGTESGEALWGTLNSKFLRESPASLNLKHGSLLQGTWRVMGIVDALPGEQPVETTGNEMYDAFGQLHEEMRKVLGRSTNEYGILPLLIFRNIQK